MKEIRRNDDDMDGIENIDDDIQEMVNKPIMSSR